MTPEATLKAAAAALRREPEPTQLHTALAEWLEEIAREAGFFLAAWRRAGYNVPELTEENYRFPLAVARTVLEERDES